MCSYCCKPWNKSEQHHFRTASNFYGSEGQPVLDYVMQSEITLGRFSTDSKQWPQFYNAYEDLSVKCFWWSTWIFRGWFVSVRIIIFFMNIFETTIKVYHRLQNFWRAARMEGLDRFLYIKSSFSLSVPRAASAKILNHDYCSNFKMSKVHCYEDGSL